MVASLRRCTLDIEANNLLNNETIDYTASPYRLKDNYKMWCIVCLDIDSDEVFKFGPDQIKTDFMQFKSQIGTLIAHNGINYDLLALKLYLGIDYHIPYDVEDKGRWDGREVNIIDTMILSKTLNPDRFGGHSLDEWGKRVGYNKIDWRAEAIKLGLIAHDAPKGAEFQQYHPAMMDYCVRDNEVTKLTYLRLMQEWGNWPFEEASCTEHKVADIITRQSHRGFDFKKTQAEDAVRDLDTKIENIKIKVEPVLPSKKLPKTKLKDYTPTTKQFNKDGSFSANMVKFVNKHGGEFLEDNKVKIYGIVYDTPLPIEPLVSEAPSTLKDTTHIKEWLVGLGWEPTQFKERDLTVDSKKKKLTAEKFEAAVNRYVEQTLESNFCKFRLEHVKTTEDKLLEKLLAHDISKPLKVLTNPTFTVGQEKEIDPMLERMVDIFPYTQDLVEYLTYNHRRNSILGGGFDPDEDEEDDYEKGFLANIREDGRISTPARTCDCATGRMQHNIVANIPRVTSLYGDVMRGLFGVSSGFVQVGYDFSSLEARIEAHYTWRYDTSSTKEYCNSLILEKPHDVHSITAKKITNMIGKEFSRGNAKSVKYACSYGAQALKLMKTIGCDMQTAEKVFKAFWEAAAPLAKLKENLTKYWETTGQRSFILGLDKRRIPTRSKHALVNSLFQSAGVIVAKKAMILHERKLREEGYYVDFFVEDWKNKKFCQQLIAYHKQHCGFVS